MKKVKTLFLAVLMLVLTTSPTVFMTSCGEAKNDDNKFSETEGSEIINPESAESIVDDDARPNHNVPSLDFEGDVFNILYPNWQGYLYYFFADESNGDAMNDAIFNRTIAVEQYLNVDITQTCPGYIEAIYPQVKQSVTAQDDSFQLILNHCIQNVSAMVTEGLLYNFDKLQYVDYNAEWWNREMMDTLRLGKNTYYGVSDYMIPCPYAIFFNKSIITDYNLDNPYQLVYEGAWTLDKFCEMAAAAVNDTNGDGKITNDDIRGICVEEGSKYISFMTGCDQYLTKKNDDGVIELAINTDKMVSIVEKLAALSKIDGVIAAPNSLSVADGNLLFELHTLSHAVNYRDSEVDIGVLPYPKFDENQENYVSLDWGGLMAIPATILQPDMVGAVIELLSYESGNEVVPTYYDVLLSGKLARDTDTVAMLDIMFDTIAYEVGGNYFGFEGGLTNLFYTTSSLAIDQKSTDFVSWYKKNEKLAAAVLNRFYKSLEKVEEVE